MRAAAITLGALLGCGPMADGETVPAGVLARMTTADDIAAFVRTAADASPLPPPAPRPPSRFALPPSAPVGPSLTITPVAVADGDRRTVIIFDRWSPDDGRPTRTERYVVSERIGAIRHGRRYATSLEVIEAQVIPPPTGPGDTPPHGDYVRLAEPIMLGDAGAGDQFFKSPFDLDHPNLEAREQQALYDLTAEEDNVDRLMTAVHQQPLRVGETVDLAPTVWTSHMVASTIHREPDRAGLARYLLGSRDEDRRMKLTVDPARGRPVGCRMEFYRATTEIAFRYPD